jgi:hypothetical protein
MEFPRRPLPPLAGIRQQLPTDKIENVRGHTRAQVAGAAEAARIRPGARIAITAGSRGIGGCLGILGGIADAVRDRGGEPFIVPAMGSHGGATAEGQHEILRRLGVETLGIPVRAGMETVTVGTAPGGAAAHVDRLAHEADGIIVMGRVKTHPESAGPLASGLLKMCTIGLGKQAGAFEAHSHGLWNSVREVPRLQLAHSPVLLGVAVVENGYRQPVAIEAVPPRYEAFLEADLRLLETAKRHLALIPFDPLDLLIVDELGKTVSGAGMDPNVIGHWRIHNAPKKPDIRRIVVLSLTHASLGNGLGAGLADFTTARFARACDPHVTYVNLLTASEPDGTTREGPMPLALASDREAIEVALFSSLAGARPRICRIKNTAELGSMWVSEALADEVAARPGLSVITPAAPVTFSPEGNLL